MEHYQGDRADHDPPGDDNQRHSQQRCLDRHEIPHIASIRTNRPPGERAHRTTPHPGRIMSDALRTSGARNGLKLPVATKHAPHRQSREIDVTHVLREKHCTPSIFVGKQAEVIGAIRRLPCLWLSDKENVSARRQPMVARQQRHFISFLTGANGVGRNRLQSPLSPSPLQQNGT